MRTHANMHAKGTTRVNNQPVVFELKQRVVLALNKLADRDTYQIGVEELGKTIECLTPDGVAPFLSCILDTDSEHKCVVRKECIRLMGVLATFHVGLISPHLGKMVASIVKRLKDSDSVVRDACVDTVGVLASKLSISKGENDGVFVVLVKPLFEVLGEQNKQVQSGSALCLARAIDNTHDPPISVLQRMLTRTIKLLKNPHFMAKPAAIELNRSIIQAGGAQTQNVLSAAITSIQEGLKNSDWTTRKAACAALGHIAASGGSFFGSFRLSSIRSLESCRFDKVKPVRDIALQSLQLWRSLPGPDTPEPSEAGSSIKETFLGADITSVSDSTLKDAMLTKVGMDSFKRSPLSVRKAGQNYVENAQRSRAIDLHIEIAVPTSPNISLADIHSEESEGSSITKRTRTDITSTQAIAFQHVPIDDKQEYSSVSNPITCKFEAKLGTIPHGSIEEDSSVNHTGRNQRFVAEEISIEEQSYLAKTRDRMSLDSTVTESSSHALHGCCLQTANEIVSIRKQLSEIENKQSNLLDLLKMFTTEAVDSLSTIQLKVSSLEQVVDRLTQGIVHGERSCHLTSGKLLKSSPSIASPRFSTSTPRPSVEISNREPMLLRMKNAEVWEEKTFARRKSISSDKQGVDTRTEPTVNKNVSRKDAQKSSGQGMNSGQTRKTEFIFAPASTASFKQISLERKTNWRKLIKGYLLDGDPDSAYVEALCSGSEIVFVELIDRTGPVLENLSHKTASDVLSTLASYFLEQRFMNSIIPWLQQVVDLSTIHGPHYLTLSAKARREFLFAIQEATHMEFPNSPGRRSVTQLSMKLHQIWGDAVFAS